MSQKQWKKDDRQGQLLLVSEYLLITAESGELVLVQADRQGMEELDKVINRHRRRYLEYCGTIRQPFVDAQRGGSGLCPAPTTSK